MASACGTASRSSAAVSDVRTECVHVESDDSRSPDFPVLYARIVASGQGVVVVGAQHPQLRRQQFLELPDRRGQSPGPPVGDARLFRGGQGGGMVRGPAPAAAPPAVPRQRPSVFSARNLQPGIQRGRSMSQADTLRNEIARLSKKEAALKKDLAKHRDAEQKALAQAAHKRREAARTKSDATRRVAGAAAEHEEKKAAAAAKSSADAYKKIADNIDAIARKQKSLDAALGQKQRESDRADEQRRRKERAHAREIQRLSRPTTEIRYVEIHPPKPEPLRVLYLTANPQAVERTITNPDGSVVQEGVWLRVDREVRAVKEQIRGSKYRDQIIVEHLSAVTLLDIFNGLNDHRPHVVHFSGHADALGVLLEDEHGSEWGAGLDFPQLARVLGATDSPPDLLVVNACESLEGAEDLLQTVPVVIGMSDSIHDVPAIAFAAHFYAGIASGQSVGSSLDQAKLKMELLALGDEDLPQAKAREDVDLFGHILIQPPS